MKRKLKAFFSAKNIAPKTNSPRLIVLLMLLVLSLLMVINPAMTQQFMGRGLIVLIILLALWQVWRNLDLNASITRSDLNSGARISLELIITLCAAGVLVLWGLLVAFPIKP